LDTLERVYAKVDLDSVDANIDLMESNFSKPTPIMAVIKTNAYGHGAVAIARTLEGKDAVCGYAVATAEEALQLRKAGIQKMILILGYVFPKDYERLILEQVRFCVFRQDMAKEISEVACRLGETAYIHIKIDTGMHRIGFQVESQSIDDIEKISRLPMLRLEGIFTHFARADETDKSDARQQYQKFTDMIVALENRGISFAMKHCSNSASILELPEFHMDMVRAGITLYGLWPSAEVKKCLPLQPVLSLYSHIVHIKTLPRGSAISYGGTYQTKGPQQIATVPIGYGDGYPRSLSNCGFVLLHGRRAPIVGRVCMDQLMIDVTDIPQTQLFDTVTLLGQDGEESITMEELGELSGRFNYELACDIGLRVPRYFYRNGKKIGELDFFA
jgi:alanine racemase